LTLQILWHLVETLATVLILAFFAIFGYESLSISRSDFEAIALTVKPEMSLFNDFAINNKGLYDA
jgi:hypothetical protein